MFTHETTTLRRCTAIYIIRRGGRSHYGVSRRSLKFNYAAAADFE